MPTYDYRCISCKKEKEVFHSIKEDPEILCDCGSKMTRMLPKSVSFVLKGLNWSGKNLKEKSYRKQRRKEIGKKMIENHDIPQIQPNYKGEVCSNWKEAERLAKADGLNTAEYEKKVETLVSQQNKVNEKVEKIKRGED